jgi:hypothetical protein
MPGGGSPIRFIVADLQELRQKFGRNLLSVRLSGYGFLADRDRTPIIPPTSQVASAPRGWHRRPLGGRPGGIGPQGCSCPISAPGGGCAACSIDC